MKVKLSELKWYEDNNQGQWAIDSEGNEYVITYEKKLKKVAKYSINPLWGGSNWQVAEYILKNGYTGKFS